MRHVILTIGFLFACGSAYPQIWQQLPEIPGPAMDGAFTFTIDGTIYVGGGYNYKRLRAFDTATGTWSDRGPLPNTLVDRWIGVGFAIGDKGYMGLGYDGPGLKNDLWEFDPMTNGWTQLADHPGNGIGGSIAFSVDGKAYIGGGADNSEYYGQLHEYDPMTNSWSLVAGMPMNETLFGNAFTIGDRAFVIGGDHGGSEDGQLYEFDPLNYDWIPRAQFIGSPRQAAVSFAIGSIGYYGGGHTEYLTGFDDFFAYDALNDAWYTAGDIPGGIRGWAVGTGVGEKGYVGSGFDLDDEYLSDWWSFDQLVGLSEVATPSSFSLYPTITTEFVNITRTEGAAGTFIILDAAGRIVIPSVNVQGSLQVNVSSLAAGVYHVKPMSHGIGQAKMFVKE
jgi:N-acetylneuraminic acid mutarotase